MSATGRPLIVVPPFASIEFPSLDAGIVSGCLDELKVAHDVTYISNLFSAFIGRDRYVGVSNVPPPKGVADYVGMGKLNKLRAPPSNLDLRKFAKFDDYSQSVAGHTIELTPTAASELWEAFLRTLCFEPSLSIGIQTAPPIGAQK